MLLASSSEKTSGPYRKSRSQSSMGIDPGHDSMTWRTWTWNLGGDPAKGHDVFLHRWYFSGTLGASVRRVFLLFSVCCLCWFHGFHGESSEQWRDMRNGESTSRSKFLVDWDKTPLPCCICTLLAANPSFIWERRNFLPKKWRKKCIDILWLWCDILSCWTWSLFEGHLSL